MKDSDKYNDEILWYGTVQKIQKNNLICYVLTLSLS